MNIPKSFAIQCTPERIDDMRPYCRGALRNIEENEDGGRYGDYRFKCDKCGLEKSLWKNSDGVIRMSTVMSIPRPSEIIAPGV